MSKRHEKLGIKQTIQKDWMDRVLRMLLAGMAEAEIRNDLNEFLATQKQSGGVGTRGDKTYGMAIGILGCWFSPDEELRSFRDNALRLARQGSPAAWLPLHWAVISAAYPFWFYAAKQVGRLLNLQDQITQPQVFNRLKEQYGDRETVARNARYTVRSFIAWGVLQDSATRGCYVKSQPQHISDPSLAVLLIESALHATPTGKATLGVLLNEPALFPFQFPGMTGDTIARHTNRIEVVRYGLDEELLQLKGI